MKNVHMTKEVAEAFDTITNWAKELWPPKIVYKDYICRERTYRTKSGKKITAKAMRVKYKTTTGRLRWKWELINYLKSTPASGRERKV